VERIEVLRGPQNTLFGKNASAGVVNVVTRAPTEEFEGLVELTATDDDEVAFSGSLSGPISDSLGYRLTGLYSDRDGFIENVADGDDIHDRETLALRGKLRWTPGDDWDITLAGSYSDVEEACCALVVTSYGEDAAFLAPAPISVLYSEMVPNIAQDDENQKVALDNPNHQETDSEGLSLKVDYSLNDFTLTSITAYNKWENTAGADQDYSARDEPGDLAGQFSIRVWDNSDRESEFTSQEFRLLSPSYDRLDYVLGLYYAKTENTQKFDRISEIGPFTADSYQETETETWAIFGQANWQLGEATTLTTGLRYNDEEISADVTDFIDDTRTKGKDSDDVWLGGRPSILPNPSMRRRPPTR
jgi:iron complex outermembrane receptor protein